MRFSKYSFNTIAIINCQTLNVPVGTGSKRIMLRNCYQMEGHRYLQNVQNLSGVLVGTQRNHMMYTQWTIKAANAFVKKAFRGI